MTRTPLNFVYHTGGGRSCGQDCASRAVAIAMRKSYKSAVELFRHAGENPATGVLTDVFFDVMDELGWEYFQTPKTTLCREDFPRTKKSIIVSLRGHVCVVRNWTVYDTFHPSPDGEKRMYGYWVYLRKKRRRSNAK